MQDAYAQLLHAQRGAPLPKAQLTEPEANCGTEIEAAQAATPAGSTPTAIAAATLNDSDTRGLALSMACMALWTQPGGSRADAGRRAGAALACLALTILSQPPHHAANNGGEYRLGGCPSHPTTCAPGVLLATRWCCHVAVAACAAWLVWVWVRAWVQAWVRVWVYGCGCGGCVSVGVGGCRCVGVGL